MQYTTNLNLKKPTYAEGADIQEINENMDLIDTAMEDLFTSVSNGKNLLATAITGKGIATGGGDTFSVMSAKIAQITTQSVLTGNAVASHVLSGQTFYSNSPTTKLTGTMPLLGATTYTPSTAAQTIASGRYLSGTQTINAVAGLSAANVKTGVVVGGVTGTYKGTGTTTAANVLTGQTFSTASLASATGTMPNRGAVASTITTQGGVYTIPSGYHTGAGKATASFANLVAGNVKNGVNIGGVVGSLITIQKLTGSGTTNAQSYGAFSVTTGFAPDLIFMTANSNGGPIYKIYINPSIISDSSRTLVSIFSTHSVRKDSKMTLIDCLADTLTGYSNEYKKSFIIRSDGFSSQFGYGTVAYPYTWEAYKLT